MRRASCLVTLVCLLGCTPEDDASAGDAATTAPTSAGAESSGSETAEGNPSCDLLLEQMEFSCGGDDAEAAEPCAYLESEPDLELDWSVSFVEGSDDQALACVQSWLDDAGIEVSAALTGFVVSGAGYAELEPLCAAATIATCMPYATSELCAGFDEADCEAVPLCYPVYGTPLSADLDCVEPSRFAVCLASDLCSDAETNYEDPDGRCWWFNADCILGALGWSSNSDNCPQKDMVDALTDCP